MLTKDDVLASLQHIMDPEIRIGIVDLGLVYDVVIGDDGKNVEVRMTLTTPACPYGPMILTQVKDVLDATPGIEDGKVSLVWEPAWNPGIMATEAARLKLGIW